MGTESRHPAEPQLQGACLSPLCLTQCKPEPLSGSPGELVQAPPALSELGGPNWGVRLGGEAPTFAFLTISQVILLFRGGGWGAGGDHFGNHWEPLRIHWELLRINWEPLARSFSPWLPGMLPGGPAGSRLDRMLCGQGPGRQLPR